MKIFFFLVLENENFVPKVIKKLQENQKKYQEKKQKKYSKFVEFSIFYGSVLLFLLISAIIAIFVDNLGFILALSGCTIYPFCMF